MRCCELDELVRHLKSIGIDLIFSELDGEGYYLPDFKVTFINQKLNDFQVRSVIYHELKHFLEHDELRALYDKPVFHSKMEHEANDYMVNRLIKDSEGFYNYSQVIEYFDIGMGWDIKYAK